MAGRNIEIGSSLRRALSSAGLIMLLWHVASAQPAFDAASVKRTPEPRQNHLQVDRCTKGGRYVSRGAPLLWTLAWGFGISDSRISGAPGWLNSFSDAYDIEASSGTSTSPEHCRLMILALLRDRFNLKTHSQTRQAPVYELTVAKRGRLKRGGGVWIDGAKQQALAEPKAPDGWSMARLSDYLAGIPEVSRPVVDKTGLDGAYGFSLDISLKEGDGRPNVFTALEEQVGLKLKPAKDPVQFLVIDHIERPSAN